MKKYKRKQEEKDSVQFLKPNNKEHFTLGDTDYPIYRDPKGYYILVDTPNGVARVDETDWVVKQSEEVAEVTGTPATQASGSVTVSGEPADATKRRVGFLYKGVQYFVRPEADQTPEQTAQGLLAKLNNNHLTATLEGTTITLTAGIGLYGDTGNQDLVDLTTADSHTLTLDGMSGGVDEVATIPLVHATYTIFTNDKFTELYEEVV